MCRRAALGLPSGKLGTPELFAELLEQLRGWSLLEGQPGYERRDEPGPSKVFFAIANGSPVAMAAASALIARDDDPELIEAVLPAFYVRQEAEVSDLLARALHSQHAGVRYGALRVLGYGDNGSIAGGGVWPSGR